MTKELIERLRNDTYMDDEVRSHAREGADAIEALQDQLTTERMNCVMADESVKRLAARVVELEAETAHKSLVIGTWRDRHDTLATELAALRAQEPVAYVVDGGKKNGALLHDWQYHNELVVPKVMCKPLYAAPVPPVREPFDVTLDETEATLLRDMLGDDKDEAASIRLLVGPGHSGHGLYVAQAEYQDEGAILLCSISDHVAPSSINAKESAS